MIPGVYRGLKERMPAFTVRQFVTLLEDWDLLPIRSHGRVVGAFLNRGPEFHVVLDPREGHGVWLRGALREAARQSVQKHGRYTSRVANSFEQGHRIARILGMRAVRNEGGITDYEGTKP